MLNTILYETFSCNLIHFFKFSINFECIFYFYENLILKIYNFTMNYGNINTENLRNRNTILVNYNK